MSEEDVCRGGSGRFGQEIVYRVRTTPTGFKVVRLDGYGLRDGLFAKGSGSYFYGEDAEERAHNYAKKRARNDIEHHGKVAKIQPLGERKPRALDTDNDQ